MTTDTGRKVLAAHLIRYAKDDITVGQIRRVAHSLGAPLNGDSSDDLTAIVELIHNAKITITWG